MRILLYRGLEVPPHLQARMERVLEALRCGHVQQAELKKLVPTPYFRAKLSDRDRLLLKPVRMGEEGAWLILEVIPNHAYHRSRFLRGAEVREEEVLAPQNAFSQAEPVRHLDPKAPEFHLLDKPLTFDEVQEAALRAPLPLILVGPAGSGKTALVLEKLRQQAGRVLYATLSPFLAREARRLYFAHGYENPYQEPDFLSFREFLETLKVPEGREVSFRDFLRFFAPQARNYPFTHAHALFEEFRGVLLASPEGPLSPEAYMALGVRQSLYPRELRPQVYGLLRKYLDYLQEEGFYDPSWLAYRYQGRMEPTYDFVAVDEVQDLTLAQVDLLLRSLRAKGAFLFSGDSHQIVHPNFFSWAGLKSYFFREEAQALERITVLKTNYRNARNVSELANRLLRLKQARFGSVDRESTYLVESQGEREGRVVLHQAKPELLKELDRQTRESAQVAVVVLRDEDKERARQALRTPLLFSVQEAKGLEYPTVVLFQPVASATEIYQEVTRGVGPEDLEGTLVYRRARDKEDKSLEVYKFFINALYVAVTRAVEEVIWVEEDPHHSFFRLLGLEPGRELRLAVRASSREEWAKEAARLEAHGNLEQARTVREAFLKERPVPWTVYGREHVQALLPDLQAGHLRGKVLKELYEYALFHRARSLLEALAQAGHEGARNVLKPLLAPTPSYGQEQFRDLERRILRVYEGRGWKEVLWEVKDFGPNFRTPLDLTPLMLAARAGNRALLEALLTLGADPEARDPFGYTPFLHALERALLDKTFAQERFPLVVDLLAPTALDVQVEGHLVRLYPRMPEYWTFLAALAGLKALALSHLRLRRPLAEDGFTSSHLSEGLGNLPPALLPVTLVRKETLEERRTYLGTVLSRSEVESNYRPARRLFLRVRRGRYMPNPHLLLRLKEGGEAWSPLQEVMDLAGLGLERA
ncbi:MAG: hypothetical protein HZB27_14775 [Meiothermus silvanus]|nr:hypothetical protein [Allomeiothermus silvanus]